jgi:hypothetical protein
MSSMLVAAMPFCSTSASPASSSSRRRTSEGLVRGLAVFSDGSAAAGRRLRVWVPIIAALCVDRGAGCNRP